MIVRPRVLIPIAEVERRVGRKKSWVYANKDFPRPVKTAGTNLWVEDEIEAFIQALIDARDGVKIAA